MAAKDVAYGPMPGTVSLQPQYASMVPAGQPRPMGIGEYIRNPSGSWSSEITTTTSDPRLNDGRPSVIPTLWLINGQPHRVTEDQAMDLAVQSGLKFPGFETQDQAEQWSQGREDNWQHVKDPADTASWSSFPALWQTHQPQVSDYEANVLGMIQNLLR